MKNITRWYLLIILMLLFFISITSSGFSQVYDERRKPSQPRPFITKMTSQSDLSDRLVQAIAEPGLLQRVVHITYEGAEQQAAVFTQPLQGFPRSGNQFIVLSTGPASNTPGVATTFSSVDMEGIHIPGGSPDGFDAYDVATLTIRLDLSDLPADPEPRLVFRYKFASEEPPEYWGSEFQDYFTAIVRDAGGQEIENIAVLPGGIPFTIDNARPYMNPVTGTSEEPLPEYPKPNDVVFNAVTGIHTTSFNLAHWIGKEIELVFQIGDVGDAIYDSGVFIDGLEIQSGPLPDFWIESVEFNQATQSIGPGQIIAADQLVAGKRTAVRVYIVGENNEKNPKMTSAHLYIYKDGSPVDGSPFIPTPLKIQPINNPSRFVLDKNKPPTLTGSGSLQFTLPGPAFREPGNYQFYVVVDRDGEVDEADVTNNRFPMEGFNTFTLHERERLQVLQIEVTTVDNDGNPVNEFNEFDHEILKEQRILKNAVFPVPSVHRIIGVPMQWNLDATSKWWQKKKVGDLTTNDGINSLMTEIDERMKEYNQSFPDLIAHTVVAILPGGTDLRGNNMHINGYGNVGTAGSIVTTRRHATLAHEIAHNWLPSDFFPEESVKCLTEEQKEDENRRRDFNHDDSDSGEDGFNPSGNRLMLFEPNFLRCRSSYDAWVSPTTYSALFNNNMIVPSGETLNLKNISIPMSDLKSQQVADAMRISGWISDDGNLIVRPIRTIETDTYTLYDPMGDYLMELQGPELEVLFSLRFSPSQLHGDGPPNSGLFSLVVPRPSGLRNIAFKSINNGEEGILLTTIEVSENPPAVTVLSPKGGENITGPFIVEWEASDPDDDVLFYTVQYAPEGDRFQVITNLLTETSYRMDPSHLPGGTNARIRIIASDGVNSASDVSAEFTVANKPPQADIVLPKDDWVISLGEVAYFEGVVYDLEDGKIIGDQLEWRSDIDGILGAGESITTIGLSPGIHKISLTATDSDGNTGTDSITLTVIDTTPESPAGVLTTPGHKQVEIKWKKGTDEYVAGYRVYWGTVSGVYGADFNVGDTTAHVIRNLTNGTTYFFAVTAYDLTGNESDFSTELKATPVAVPDNPLLSYPPNDTTGVPIALSLSWEESERAENYRLQLSDDYLFETILLDTSYIITTGLQVGDLDHSRTYYWRVMAHNDEGNSSWSAIWSFATESYTPLTYTLTLEVNPGNGGSAIGAGEFGEGENVTITAIPNEGYRFVNWTGETDNLEDTDAETGIVTMPAEDVTLTANFDLKVSAGTVSFNELKIFPNPLTDNITLQNASGVSRINVSDLLGKIIIDTELDGSEVQTITTAILPGGIYLLILWNENGQKEVRTLVKQ